ncbi:MAG: 23S rRNA pseudouridine(1911/1915/1917) synthase RluD [Coxiellaceae bacterium]|nr:23S rRNA pseudouridine(1911/1915/1917) synthase RluD [Coxiellaceae bacterium]
MSTINLDTKIPETLNGQRFDQAISSLFPQYSRTQHQIWIKSGQTTLDGKQARIRDKVQTDQHVQIQATLGEETSHLPQDIPLDIIYEDEDLIIANKPAGLVAHPGAGNPDQTLVNALLHHDSELSKLPRAGLIHRLDKDTSGLLTIARNLESYNALAKAMQAREIHREYEAIVQGVLISGGTVEASIGRHPRARTLMAVVKSGKPAVTHYRVIEKFRGHTHLRVNLDTGRTHQIRVHLNHIGYPIVGDKSYLKQIKLPREMSETAKEAVKNFPRQALHAIKLELYHPISGKLLTLISPRPDDMENLLNVLKKDNET